MKEPQNLHDQYAIAAYSENGQIGYVSNSEKTTLKGCLTSSQIYELMNDTAHAEVKEAGYHNALCCIDELFDVDKMILKAFEIYNEAKYDEALIFFEKLKEKYDSVFLMQYIGDCYIKTEKFEQAINILEKALLKEPENKVSLMMYATSLENLGEYQKAIRKYSKILENRDSQEVKKAIKRCKDKEKAGE